MNENIKAIDVCPHCGGLNEGDGGLCPPCQDIQDEAEREAMECPQCRGPSDGDLCPGCEEIADEMKQEAMDVEAPEEEESHEPEPGKCVRCGNDDCLCTYFCQQCGLEDDRGHFYSYELSEGKRTQEGTRGDAEPIYCGVCGANQWSLLDCEKLCSWCKYMSEKED
jgi:hypothetical protein